MAVPISNVTRRAVYAPSGAGGVGPYAFTFEILANTDIAVFKDNTLLTLTTHYTVTINANGTGSVTITAAGLALSPTSPTQYAIVGNRTIARSTDFTTGGDFFANTINDELDQQTIFAQQNAEGLNRALQAPQTDPTTINMTLPAKATRASKTLAFDADGNPTPGVSAADVANAVTYATNAANSATAAASSASSASSSASAASASASTASTQASNASTSASNASTSASNASTSASNAAASASTATTQASNASTSATNAASSASAASTSASNAATSATNASNSATTASTQASNAATSASSASGSATSAANSAAAAASALDSFDDRYLGTKTSDPTLDNDGNALAAGALYFSTTQNVMKVYDGASWITATSAGATSLLRFRYVATSGQTTFSGADAASATLTYTVNNIAVHRNGVTLDTSEYTASNGTSIVLNVAAGTGDIVDIIAFKSFTVADALSAVSGGTVNGAVTITGVTTVQAGTAAAPAITTTGDTNTGIFFPAADTIAFSEGGTEAMRIDSSGNVGIGTSSPSRKFVVSNAGAQGFEFGAGTGSGSSNEVLNYNRSTSLYVPSLLYASTHTFYAGTAGGTRAVDIDSSGNVGIGLAPTGDTLLEIYGANSATTYKNVNTGTGSSDGFYVGMAKSSGTDGYVYNRESANVIFGTANAERMRIDSSGNLLVGTTSGIGNAKLIIGGDSSTSRVLPRTDNVGYVGESTYRWQAIYAVNGTIQTSDGREKNTIEDSNLGLSFVQSLRPVSYKWNVGENVVTYDEDGKEVITPRAGVRNHYGFIAQEVKAVIPEGVDFGGFVQEPNDGMMSLRYHEFIGPLVKAIQELKALVDTQASTITALQADVAALKGNA